MWGAEAGWWCGALAATAVLLALYACRARCRRKPHVQLVVSPPAPLPLTLPRARPSLAPPPRKPRCKYPTNSTRCIRALLSGSPADEPPQPPQIIIVKNDNPTIVRNSNFIPSTSVSVPKLPLPEQFLHKRPIDYKYTTIPRPLAQLNADLGADLTQESRAKKYSATRSPSLEKDEKSPFVSSATPKTEDVFGFDTDLVRRLSEDNSNLNMASKETDQDSPGNLKRFKSVSTRLNMCSVNEAHFENQQERHEMQNSPRVVECSSAKEKTSKFDFSPKLLDTLSSPRFFTPPETVSPMFFNEPSPKSVYYDSVRSPKFFPETPRDTEVPQSPRALGDHLNRNGLEKPSSPRILPGKPSPKVHSYNKENYFTFEQSCLDESRTRPNKYGGRNSIERERFTPPADKDVRKYKRHNSCDTYKTVELNIPRVDNKQTDLDVVDCCAKIETIEIDSLKTEEKTNELTPGYSAQSRRQRLKSISLDSDNAKIIEQNLGLPIAKQIKDQMNEAYKNDVSASCESMERYQKTPTNLEPRPCFKFDDPKIEPTEEEPKSPGLIQKKCLRQSSDTQSFIDMPRFSPKEFEITVTSEEGSTTPADTQTKPKTKNLRNLTIDLSKRDSELEKELLEFEKLYTDAEEKKVKTPTLKVKATSLDSSETVNLSLPQKKTLDVPQNSVSVPNTPKRQLKRILAQKNVKHDFCGGKIGFNSIQSAAEQRRLFMKGQDSGIYLREHHANLMLYQPGTSRIGSRTMRSFDENTQDFENTPEINICGAERSYLDPGQSLGSNLLNYKQNLSVSSTNLKTLPEGVPSDDFEPSAEDEKVVKKLHRRNSNQSLMLSTHSLQSSNCSLSSSGASCHNFATVRTSISNFSLNDSRQKKLSLDRRDSASLMNTDHLTPKTRVICSSSTNISDTSKNCLLQRRGSNNSLTLNIQSGLSRHSSNSSLNKDGKTGQKKGLLERRSSNTSLTLNINTSNPQLSVNRGLSISNYNLNGSSCNLSRYNSNHSIDNANTEPRKGILERRNSNTSLTLNIQPQEPRDIEIDETLIDPSALQELPHRDKHRKSLSTENLIAKSYKCRTRTADRCAFGSHDNLWSTAYTEQEFPTHLTYVCGDQENEIIYAFGRQEEPNFQPCFVRNITTKPLSPHSTSDDFRRYLANMQHLQNASSVLTRVHLKKYNEFFQRPSKFTRSKDSVGDHSYSEGVVVTTTDNPQQVIPEIGAPCSSEGVVVTTAENPQQVIPEIGAPCSSEDVVFTTAENRQQVIPELGAPCSSEAVIVTTAENPQQEIPEIGAPCSSENKEVTTAENPQQEIPELGAPCGSYQQRWLNNLYNEFWDLPTNFQEKPIVSGSHPKNRYKTILPNEHSRFILRADASNTEGYINANFIKGHDYTKNSYVATQGPLQNTIYDFWLMVHQNCTEHRTKHANDRRAFHIQKVVMLTDFIENNRQKCEKYFPVEVDAQLVVPSAEKDSSFVIKNCGLLIKRGYTVRKLTVLYQKSDSDSDSSEVTVYHYWLKTWADHTCSIDVNALLNLSVDVLRNVEYNFDSPTDNIDPLKCETPKCDSKFVFPPLEKKPDKPRVKLDVTYPIENCLENLSPPIIIHCSAGIGRTGCLIAILNGIKQLLYEQKVDVLGIVCNMRLSRGGMVQNVEQYELVHKVISLYAHVCLPELSP